ncbi:MAG: TetR/AcrR family transcriptional regulator, transcriptional repressor for nem operon [Kribbellaceae bacterium]|jgi:TetR/AcrR family transcriptional repressor of nem operon|nr:TetR/AcrR family transcriptional regulator, transcriptional repressor for nem operon [Kribbellaceae bacterium]
MAMGRPMKFEADEALDKAVEVFWQRGFAATTPQNLADELGIGRGSLYNTFKSKHHLFGLALRRYSANRVTALAAGLDGPGPILPRLREAMRTLAGIGDHRYGCLIVNSVAELGSTDEGVADVAKDLFIQIEHTFRAALERAHAAGELTSPRSPTDSAAALLATVIGTSVLAKSGATATHLNHTLDAALDDI